MIQPISVIMEEVTGNRVCLQPWVDPADPLATSSSDKATVNDQVLADPLHDYLEELQELLAETWLTGPRATASGWKRLSILGTSLGFGRLANFETIEQAERLLEVTAIADFAYREFSRLDGAETEAGI